MNLGVGVLGVVLGVNVRMGLVEAAGLGTVLGVNVVLDGFEGLVSLEDSCLASLEGSCLASLEGSCLGLETGVVVVPLVVTDSDATSFNLSFSSFALLNLSSTRRILSSNSFSSCSLSQERLVGHPGKSTHHIVIRSPYIKLANDSLNPISSASWIC